MESLDMTDVGTAVGPDELPAMAAAAGPGRP